MQKYLKRVGLEEWIPRLNMQLAEPKLIRDYSKGHTRFFPRTWTATELGVPKEGLIKLTPSDDEYWAYVQRRGKGTNSDMGNVSSCDERQLKVEASWA